MWLRLVCWLLMAGLMLGVIVNSVVYTFYLVVGFVLLCWYAALLDLFMLVILFVVGVAVSVAVLLFAVGFRLYVCCVWCCLVYDVVVWWF